LRSPMAPGRGVQAGTARIDVDAVGDDEGGVEADAELTDELRVLLLVAGHAGEELGGAGLGDRAEVLDRLVAAHADAVVGDRGGARRGIRVAADDELAAPVSTPGRRAPRNAASRARRRRWKSARAGRFPCGCTANGSSA